MIRTLKELYEKQQSEKECLLQSNKYIKIESTQLQKLMGMLETANQQQASE